MRARVPGVGARGRKGRKEGRVRGVSQEKEVL